MELRELIEEMKKIDIIRGKFDAVHGSWEFMHGVAAVMENLASRVSDEYLREFQDEFWKNFNESTKATEE